MNDKCNIPELKLSAFRVFLEFWAKNPIKVAILIISIIVVAMSAIAVVGFIIWFFVLHPNLLLKTLSL